MAYNLPSLFQGVPLVEEDRSATLTMQKWWQEFIKTLLIILNSLQDQVTAIAAAQAAADAANAAAAAANTAATTAQTAAATASAQNAIQNSYPIGAALTATDAGSDVTISVAAHTRYYGDGTSVAVNAGNVTALAYSTDYYVYYDDAGRAGGAVTYQVTTSVSTAAQVGNRHLIGKVTTPAAAGPPNTGGNVQPPGVGDLP